MNARRGAHLGAVVDAVRGYRTAETAMRGQSRNAMHLGRTDLTALRLLLRAGRSGTPLSAAHLARELKISTAATTVLIDRLEERGHVERRRSPTDGRGIEVWTTDTADREVRLAMGSMHEQMMSIAGALEPAEARVIRSFLEGLANAMTDLDRADSMIPSAAGSGAGFWYPQTVDSVAGPMADRSTATGLDVLNALRAYREVEQGLRRRLGQLLAINETDLGALRYVLVVWQRDQAAGPKKLAAALGISSASTTLVIDRLEKAGYLRRRPHPVDRRAVLLEPGDLATEEFRSALDIERRGVLTAADNLSSEDTETITRFLRRMEQAMAGAVATANPEAEAWGPDSTAS